MRLYFAALVICAALTGCDADPGAVDRAAALGVLGTGLQNYGNQRAAYQPTYQPAVLCQPVGRTVMCY